MRDEAPRFAETQTPTTYSPMVTKTSVARRIQANRRLVRDGARGDDVDQAKSRFDAVFAAYPGIVAERSRWRAQADGFVVTCAFATSDLGRAAAFAVDFIAGRGFPGDERKHHAGSMFRHPVRPVPALPLLRL